MCKKYLTVVVKNRDRSMSRMPNRAGAWADAARLKFKKKSDPLLGNPVSHRRIRGSNGHHVFF